MASTYSSSLSSLSLQSRPHSISRETRHLSTKNRPLTIAFASRRDAHGQNHNGRAVDENLIVLRKRIHEMKMIERNYEPPADWSDWEKKYYASYDSYICEAMGFLQSQLMETRPSVALAMLALLTMSVPVSTAVVISNLLEITKGVLCSVHVN